ncbi:MAG: 50S ribosomal protein L4 [Candidatus Rokubacteria bacterium]|nr:50S ribosomal protein L4 [Candidatus Rokubacteria bacterium]
MPAVPVLSTGGKAGETLDLRPEVFGVPLRVPLLHQAVVRELAAQRAGTHETKGRSDVSGGGKKPWRQKGTGRARQGSIRAAQWRKGGTVFGPHPRDYTLGMPRAARRQALRAALAAAVADARVAVVDRVELREAKTKALAGWLLGLGLKEAPTLLVVAQLSQALARASRNLPWLVVETPSHVSVYQLLRNRQVIFERPALLTLQEALAGAVERESPSTSGGTR